MRSGLRIARAMPCGPAHVPSAASGEERANILLLACCTQEDDGGELRSPGTTIQRQPPRPDRSGSSPGLVAGGTDYQRCERASRPGTNSAARSGRAGEAPEKMGRACRCEEHTSELQSL